MKPSGEEEEEEGGQFRAHKNTHVKLMLTSLSAMAAETSTFPIDLTKTRLQLESRSRTNAFRVATEIVREQGPLGLYKGLSPAIIRHLFYTPIRIVAYENLRNAVVSSNGDGGSLSLSAKALAGGFSGVIAQ
ncbi:hypothetical protein CMV_020023 [Castanea mollissima]|nr:hypothetical protein CMV_020023 [Castanea mollissima]